MIYSNCIFFKNRSVANKGFTLIELSISLLIIGLIAGGLVVGQTLLRQSQISSIMTDAQRYISATNMFQQKYNALPGDMANATDYWGGMATCPPVPASQSANSTLTCNGDGNGGIYTSSVPGPSNRCGASRTLGAVGDSEPLLYWQHLSNAKLVQGTYTGISGSIASYWINTLGVNIPASRLPGVGFGIGYESAVSGSPYWFDSFYHHVIVVGGTVSGLVRGALPCNPMLTTLEAQSFDQKYDDGLPASGIIQTFPPFGLGFGNCATTAVNATALYNTLASSPNSSGLQCSLIIVTGF